MPIAPGTRLGAYEVVALLGAGGMGEVYRGRDIRLKRDVAIKVLPDALAADPNRIARFQREAELLATLNHTNIAGIYGLEEHSGLTAIVLELVEGEDLAQRIARGPVPIDESVVIARQIADALEAAHDRGVVHRDLKPANIKVTPDGKVKILDFGLAKLVDQGRAADGAPLSMSPTLTAHATYAGVILGTAAYMSPEQARGKPVDRRTDIWAFGCVLYEMLVGSTAFAGDTISDHIAAILHQEPDWARLPAETPDYVRRLLRRCLQKDLRNRLPHIGEARIEIDDPQTSQVGAADGSRASRSNAAARRLFPWAVAAVSAVLAGLALWAPWRKTTRADPVHLTAYLGADVSLVTEGTAGGASAVLSPAGTLLAFVGQTSDGRSQLYVRPLSQSQANALEGTDQARYPFFSPDGKWIGFFASGKLKKVAATGGSVVPLADAADARGGTWAEDGTIAFVPGGKYGSNIMHVPSAGGRAETLVGLRSGEVTQRWPQFLLGGRSILFTSHSRLGDLNDAELVVQSLPEGARTVLKPHGYYGRYVQSGHLLFARDSSLFAARFDPLRPDFTGDPMPVANDLVTRANTGTAQFDASANGTLVYLPKTNETAPLQLVERTGKTSSLCDTAANWGHVRFSPDGRRLAMDIADGTHTDVWICELATGTLTRLTLDQSSSSPVWTPDGRRVAFASTRDGPVGNIYWQRADGTGEPQRLTQSPNLQVPESWHPSGKVLAFVENRQSSDVMLLPMQGDEASGWKPGTPTAFAEGPNHELTPSFSPDGSWIAFASNEGTRFQIQVRQFPIAGGTWVVSAGIFPQWSRTQRELFYGTLDDGLVMVVPYSVTGNSFRAGTPRQWSPSRFMRRRGGGFEMRFEVHPDGERVVMTKRPDETEQNKLVFVFNFFEELRQMFPIVR